MTIGVEADCSLKNLHMPSLYELKLDGCKWDAHLSPLAAPQLKHLQVTRSRQPRVLPVEGMWQEYAVDEHRDMGIDMEEMDLSPSWKLLDFLECDCIPLPASGRLLALTRLLRKLKHLRHVSLHVSGDSTEVSTVDAFWTELITAMPRGLQQLHLSIKEADLQLWKYHQASSDEPPLLVKLLIDLRCLRRLTLIGTAAYYMPNRLLSTMQEAMPYLAIECIDSFN
ncbi:hypothetical protein CEUSTIGMA_g4146.t1 [Chlamydomonas eustigma]|uniref:Uncharacterized protein n=1 Tax=Chlamydomonas eustigma TaxID=1157962 RepID=A0A250X1T6_9CHLO|nr:hypothetical protein CEUSTIGMA_g4146.t1 [Chlamydomonas eustigma]|eukprot:GAX76700.1 hypothetical protein CEUSTIGMA_g4146.t1 [Chlamydomonas eustigma]